MPVYNDWASAAMVCERVWTALEPSNVRVRFLTIDDGSTEAGALILQRRLEDCPAPVSVLRLRRNVGHQRAIALGLAYVHEHLSCDAVVVMDADGEDIPEHVMLLLEQYYETGGSAVVFAARGRRMEVLSFKVLYHCYRLLHRALTGFGIRVGNFSLIPFRLLRSLVGVPELWSHYAASVFKAKIPYVAVRADRGTRLCGASKMSLVGLVAHGLYALACFHEVVAMRLLFGSVIGGAALLAVGVAPFLYARGPAVFASSPPLLLLLLTVIVVQLVATCFGFVFLLLSARSHLGFLPLRDYQYFIDDCTEIREHEYADLPR